MARTQLIIATAALVILTISGTQAIHPPPGPSTIAELAPAAASHSSSEIPLGPAKAAPAPPLTTEQLQLVDWALSRFSAVGLRLPEIAIEFFPTTMDCMGHKGLYYAAELRLRMCSLDDKIMLHELSHAWANEALSTEDRRRFVEFRGLDAWNDQDYAWELRGTEHAAEIIAWGLMDVPIHVRWVEDGTETHKLLTIPDSDVAELAAGFELLTGRTTPFRHASEWETPPGNSFSPEAAARP